MTCPALCAAALVQLLVSCATTVHAQQAAALAVITAVAGEGSIHPAAGSATFPPAVGSLLSAGDSLHLADGAWAVLLFQGGEIRRLERSTRIAPPVESPRPGLLARAVQTLVQVASTDLRAQPNRQGMIRPLPGTIVLRAPRNEILLSAPRPTFAWTKVPDVEHYRLLIRAEGGRVLRFEAIADTLWTVPDDAPPLTPGDYSWTVAAEPRGRPAEAQRFRIPAAAEHQALAEALATLQAFPDAGGETLLLGEAILYHAAGYQYEARQRMERLLARAPAASPQVHHLHAAILEALGEAEAVEEALLREAAAAAPQHP